jgi:hypothetical protein
MESKVIEVSGHTNAKVLNNPPRPEWVRGVCPQCGAPVVSNSYYVGGKGYWIVWECWLSLGANPSCKYRKVLL